MKKAILILTFIISLTGISFGQSSVSATYSSGEIEADPFFLGAMQSSSCAGSLTVTIPLGVTITSVDVEYDFESISPYTNYEQRSELRCVSEDGENEGEVATNMNWASGVYSYSRTDLDIANLVTDGGDIEFELHAGFDNLAAIECGTDYHKVNNNTWTVTVYYLEADAPEEPTNPNPTDGEEDVLTTATFSWDFGENTDSYDLYLGTSNPPTEIVVEEEDATETGSYDPGTLESSTTYYWQVIAKNTSETELEGPIWSFSTECQQNAVPIVMDFDDFELPTSPPNGFMPLCWSKMVDCSVSTTMNGAFENLNANSAPNCYIMSNSTDLDATHILSTPQLGANDQDISDIALSFYAKGISANETLIVGTITDPTDESTFSVMQSIPLTNTMVEYEIFFNEYAGTDEYIALKFEASSTYQYVIIDDFSIDLMQSCLKPIELTGDNITSSSVILNWTEQGSATSWNIEYGISGFTPTGIPSFSTSDNPYFLTDLDPSTSYDLYIQSDCGEGDVSEWSNVNTFQTLGEGVDLPIFEDFDDSMSLPDGWTIASTSSVWWQITTSLPNSSPNCFLFYKSTLSDNIALVAPLPNASVSDLKINFYARHSWQDDWELEVGTMSDPTDITTFTSFETIITTGSSMEEYEVWFNTYTGTDSYIAITPGSTSTLSYMRIDDITIDYLFSCLNPIDLSVDEILQNEATLNWTESADATKWEIEVGIPGFTPGIGAYYQQYVYDSETTPEVYSYVMTGLEGGTYYDVYIRSICSESLNSEWSEPAQFITELDYFMDMPVLEDFESGFEVTGNIPSNTTSWTINDSIYFSSTNSSHNAYGSNEDNSLLIYGKLNLAIYTKVSLSFAHIAKVDGGSDECYVEISIDGGSTFQQIPDSLYYGTGNYSIPINGDPEGPCFNEDSYLVWGDSFEEPNNSWWQYETFDLSAYAGNDAIIRFRLSSNQYNEKAGWYIDDIMLNTYHGSEISIEPLSLSFTVYQGETKTDSLIISNLDDFPLNYSVSTIYSSNATSLLVEDFNEDFPSDWTIIDGGDATGAGAMWEWTNDAIYGNSLDSTDFMKVERTGTNTDEEELISPEIDVTGYGAVYLSFDQYFKYFYSDYIEVLVWDGTTWQLVYTLTEEDAGEWYNPDQQFIDISQFANENLQVKFYYYAESWSLWGIDNFEIIGMDQPINWLSLNNLQMVQGVVYEDNPQVVEISIETESFFPVGIYESDIEISSTDTANPVINIPVTLEVLAGISITDITAAPSELCFGESTQLSVITDGGSGEFNYTWTSEPEGFSSNDANPIAFPEETTTYYIEVNDNGIIVSGEIMVTVNPIPDVSLVPFDVVCFNWPAFELSGGLPEGGEYSGDGVIDGWFDPTNVGIGTYEITYSFTDENGCENQALEEIVVDACTDINQFNNELELNIFPNPSKGLFKIILESVSEERIDIIITNNIGDRVYTNQDININGKYSDIIDLTNLSKGLYIINVHTKIQTIQHKITIN